MNTNPALEIIEPSVGSSFTIRKFDGGNNFNTSPRWHFHPEIELVYVKGGSGKRHIGNHISQYHHGDLILVGSNLPHFGFTDRFSGTKTEIVLHFKQEFLGANFFDKVEFFNIKNLFQRAKSGLSFFGNTRSEIGQRLESLFYMTNFEKLLELLNILNIMSDSREVETLNAQGMVLTTTSTTVNKMDEIFTHVRNHFVDPILLSEISKVANMTEPAFCRFFKKNTGKTFIEFVNEFRITHACKLLAETNLPITDICYESGFNNFSHFNNYFKRVTGKSPSDFRKELSLVLIKE